MESNAARPMPRTTTPLLALLTAVAALAACAGPAGPPGVDGADGADGATGPAGAAGAGGPAGASGRSDCTVVVSPEDDVQAAIDGLPESGGTVCLQAGLYELTTHLHIGRDHVRLVGAGSATVLSVVADVAGVVIGPLDATPSGPRTRGVEVADLAIEGNRQERTSETYTTEGSALLYVNGISVFWSQDVSISSVSITGVRSGGIVTDRQVEDLAIRDVTIRDAYWDGVALYDSEHVSVSRAVIEGCGAAAVTADAPVDRGVSWSVIEGSVLSGNGVGNDEVEPGQTVAVYLRHSSDVLFTGNLVERNQGGGLWLEHATDHRLSNNLLVDNGLSGAGNGVVFNVGSQGNALSNNTVRGHPEFGLWMVGGDDEAVNFGQGNLWCDNALGAVLPPAQGRFEQQGGCDCVAGCN